MQTGSECGRIEDRACGPAFDSASAGEKTLFPPYQEELVRKCISRIAALLAVCGLAAAWSQRQPNFSGEWKTNRPKSEFGPLPANDLIWTIAHADPKLKLSVTYSGDGGDRTVDMNYLTDGVQTVNKPGALTIRSVGQWEGSELTIESQYDTERGAVTVRERWSLSEDGRTLTMQRAMSGPQANWTQKLVYDKRN